MTGTCFYEIQALAVLDIKSYNCDAEGHTLVAVEAGWSRDGLFVCCCLIAGRSPFSKRLTQHPVHADSITQPPDLRFLTV